MKQNKITNRICLFFFVIFLFSCSGKKEDADFLNAEIRTVESRLYETELFISFCKDMKVINSHFLLSCARPNWGTLVAKESDGKEIGAVGSRGAGPGEYITPFYSGKSINGDTIYIYDFSKRVILMYEIDYSGNSFVSRYINRIGPPSGDFIIYTDVCRLNNGYFVGLRGEDKVNAKALTLFDAQLNVVKTFGSVPLPLERDFSDFRKCFDNTRISVYNNSVFIAISNFGYIAGYDISDRGEITTRFEKILVEPSFHIAGGIVYNSNNRSGFSDITASKNYLFAIYGGKTEDNLKPDGTGMAPETFAVFNHDGKLISRIKLNNKAFRLAVSEDEERLYFCFRSPEFGFEVYKVSDLVK